MEVLAATSSVAVAPLTKADLPMLVQKYLAGAKMTDLAEQCGTSRRTMYRWFLGGLGDSDYYDVVTEVLTSRVADADEELEAARMSGDPVRVSAARETCRFFRMDLERRRPGLYGAKPVQVQIAAVTADAGLLGAAGDLLKLIGKSKEVGVNTVTLDVEEDDDPAA